MSDVSSKLRFLKNLQAVTNKIHSTANIDQIMLELSQDICGLFHADRLTIYVLSEDAQSIVSKVKTGLNSFRDIRLPISEQSIAGYVAYSRQAINIKDVYDDSELKAIAPSLTFLQEVDRRTGYRSRQMLAVPILSNEGDLLGVVQLINHLGEDGFSPFLEDGAKELAKTLAVAFIQRRQQLPVWRSKYDQLVSDGSLSAADMEQAQNRARDDGRELEEILEQDFKVRLEKIGETLARFFGVPYEPMRADRIKQSDLLRNLKRDYLEQNLWLPLEETGEGLLVMTTDPERLRTSRIVNNIFPKSRVVYRVTTRKEFFLTVDQFFGGISDSTSVDDLLSDLGDDEEVGELSDELAASADNELVRLVNKIIIEAHQQGASDIHIEPRPGKEKTGIRIRRDGSLLNYIEVPSTYRSALVARLKIMSELDISEKRRPQDGKIKFKKFGPLDIELRVATIPTAGGVEDIVMRILAAGEPIKLDQLGLAPGNYDNLLRCVEKPYGLFFVCGPTGSGKTTTLHSVLGYLNRPDTKIWTAEDPVEITQKGLRQVQINKKAGLDFPTVMRAFLRADPDIIMVGEMRDAETTGIGIEASLTGHLVLATLHTNSAPESVIRLLDMGMDPFNFADALLGILAQRLGKRLCKACKEAYEPSAEELEQLLREYSEELTHTDHWRANPQAARQAIFDEWQTRYQHNGRFTLYRAKGCSACGDTGYKGRLGLHELLVGSDGVKRLIQEKARVAEILALALNEGMRTLKMDGIEKVLQGLTDLKQVRSVCIK